MDARPVAMAVATHAACRLPVLAKSKALETGPEEERLGRAYQTENLRTPSVNLRTPSVACAAACAKCGERRPGRSDPRTVRRPLAARAHPRNKHNWGNAPSRCRRSCEGETRTRREGGGEDGRKVCGVWGPLGGSYLPSLERERQGMFIGYCIMAGAGWPALQGHTGHPEQGL